MTNPDLGIWINNSIGRLRGNSEYPSVEVTALASHVLQKPKEWIIAHPETLLDVIQVKALEKALDRLLDGEPLAYITGRRSFYGLEFQVDQRVLVPRPETELLVDLAIDWLRSNPARKRVVDVGTGSGAIAVTLAHHFPDLKITAIDSSPDALTVARSNAVLHHVEDRVTFIQNDLLDELSGEFDLILANLPYIPTPSLVQHPNLKHEPHSALDGGNDGLRLIEKLIVSSAVYLAQNGCVILEIQYNQGKAIREIASKQFPFAIISIHHDLAALPRVVQIQR